MLKKRWRYWARMKRALRGAEKLRVIYGEKRDSPMPNATLSQVLLAWYTHIVFWIIYFI